MSWLGREPIPNATSPRVQVTETLKICDRAYMVFQGQVMAQGSPQELVQNPFVRQYYLGEGYRRPETSINGEESISSEERPTS